MEEKKCEMCATKSTPRDEKNVRDMQNRLSRIIGQINGIKKMIEEERYCTDIMMQISACEKALIAVSDILLKEHLETCVTEKIKSGEVEIIKETIELIKTMR